MRRIIEVLAGVLLVGGSIAGTHVYETRLRTPAVIHRACGLVNDAYATADRRAETQRSLEFPPASYDASSAWSAEEQAKLERAARLVGKLVTSGGQWSGVAWAIDQAARTMSPANAAAQAAADAAAAQGDYSLPGPGIDASHVGQANALGHAQAACAGR